MKYGMAWWKLSGEKEKTFYNKNNSVQEHERYKMPHEYSRKDLKSMQKLGIYGLWGLGLHFGITISDFLLLAQCHTTVHTV